MSSSQVLHSSGIGEAAAKELASKGAKLVLAARREERLKKLQADIQNNGEYFYSSYSKKREDSKCKK